MLGSECNILILGTTSIKRSLIKQLKGVHKKYIYVNEYYRM